ncbi:LAQU0S08e01728g1_1 [Lachancea quebecensis]|uniref:LAQU0S08e01728g1_1 n=1 Tax=Lachancea quebecensis TaxID=1654605 RepID=A0A0P1KSF5_9SACH|nr:LAQU0S08e01728g1_1 [Lachancea quebecensis]
MVALTFIVSLLLGAKVARCSVEAYKSDPAIACSSNKRCPKEWPCCSQYGQCGNGPLCVGGCDPRSSFNSQSCLAIPALVPSASSSFQALGENSYEMGETEGQFSPALDTRFGIYNTHQESSSEAERIQEALKSAKMLHYSDFKAEPELSSADYTYSGFLDFDVGPQSALMLTMPPETTGSLLSSAKSFLYGRVAVTMKAAAGKGVVSAMVLMSAVKDEVDFEFLGGDLEHAQSNYYYQGELVHTRMTKARIQPDSCSEFHTYEFDWNEDRIHWLIDGAIVRTLRREDTYDPALNTYKYPQTPMRLEVAIWPGGVPSNSPGTIMWAGGLIDWDDAAAIVKDGRFQLAVKQVTITPYANAFTRAKPAKLQARSEDSVFFYFYDPDCSNFDETCVRTTPQHNHDSRQDALNASSDPSKSVQSSLAPASSSSVPTSASLKTSVYGTYTTSEFTIGRHENIGLAMNRQNLFFKLRSWLLS